MEVFLKTGSCELTPHLLILCRLSSDISLVILAETKRSKLSGSLMRISNTIVEAKSNNDYTDLGIVDSLIPMCEVEGNKIEEESVNNFKNGIQRVTRWWEICKENGIGEWLKPDVELPSRLEASLLSLLQTVTDIWIDFCTVISHLICAQSIDNSMALFQKKLSLIVSPNESSSIFTMKKYMEEFPGLVHFVYIDRFLNQMTSPQISSEANNSSSLTALITKNSLWSMVSFVRSNLIDGYHSLVWKDNTFTYSYFLWFEDTSGNPIKVANLDENEFKSMPVPGILVDDFYQKYLRKAFPSLDPQQVRTYELYCIHLGLATSACVLEQTRRLSATIWEIAGPNVINPVDLL